jgi:protocatechuate 3,4-dioxygenase alpha subunit
MTAAPIHGAQLVATPSQTVGPFFQVGLAATDALGSLVTPDVSGERIQLRLRVLDGDGMPVPDALIEIYQANSAGEYGRAPFSGFGRLATRPDGSCMFETIRPGRVADGRGGMQASHVNVCVFARGLLRHLYTRLYFAGDPDLVDDAVLALVPADRRPSLLASPAGDPAAPRVWEFVIRLQSEQQTPFFDL